MDQAIEDFIAGRRIAVVGASRDGRKFGNAASTELAARSYQVVLVHREAKEIAGVPCRPSLAAVRNEVDGVLVAVRPRETPAVLREAAAAGLKNVWLQQGAETHEALALARELGLNLVAKRCVLMYAPPVKGFHGFHRAVAGFFGKL
jgi:predicted CoA-binding protein